MFISHVNSIEKIPLSGDALKNVSKQRAIGPEEGWDSHVMRVFTLAAGGHTPRHTHPWPHINYVLQGKGVLYHEGEETVITGGSVACVPPGTEHQFKNGSEENLVFICIVPKEGDK